MTAFAVSRIEMERLPCPTGVISGPLDELTAVHNSIFALQPTNRNQMDAQSVPKGGISAD